MPGWQVRANCRILAKYVILWNSGRSSRVVIERCDASLAAPSTQRGSDAGRLSGGVD
jgi:hypothetical protein